MRAPFRRGFFVRSFRRAKRQEWRFRVSDGLARHVFCPIAWNCHFSAISAFAQMSEEQIDLTILSPLVGHPHIVATPLSLRAPIAHCFPCLIRAHRVFAYHGVQDPTSGRFFECSPFALGILLEVWSRLAGLLGKSIDAPYTFQHEIRLCDSRHTNCCA